MRRALIALVVVVVVLDGAGAAGGDRTARPASATARPARATARPVELPAGLSVRVPAGWHVLHGWLSDIADPAPRLAVASFPARLSRHTCECGFPNVMHFPRDGAFIFAWEYLNPEAQLASTPHRPPRFSLTAFRAVRLTCDGPAAEFYFKDAGRVFQVEIYLGPAAGRALRAQVAALLDSLQVSPAIE